MRRFHRAIPRLLASHWLWQSEGLQRCPSKATGHLQPVLALITRDCHARLRAVNTVDYAAIVTLLGQVRLDDTDHRHRIWIGGLIVSVIILVVVRIVIIPRIRPKPEAVVKNKDPLNERPLNPAPPPKWPPPDLAPPPPPPACPPPPPLKPPPPNPPPPPWPAAHPALARAIDVMPTKLSNFNLFTFQDRDSSVSRPLRVRRIL